MRKLILFMHMSLDGFVKAPGKDKSGKDQTVSSPGEDPGVEDSVVPDLIRDADTLLLGRLVADELLGYWLNAEARDYQLVVPPVALGDGEPLFRNLPERLKLRLAQVKELKAGALFLRYQPAAG